MCLKSKCCIMGRLGVFFYSTALDIFICEPERKFAPPEIGESEI